MLNEIINMEIDVVVIFDRQKGLMEAVSIVLPNTHHSYCLRHLAQNLYGETRDSMARKYIWVAAR